MVGEGRALCTDTKMRKTAVASYVWIVFAILSAKMLAATCYVTHPREGEGGGSER